jgi:pantoate--beta-alanine ligase
MEILTRLSDLRAYRQAQGRLGFVPTMGNLHAGHIALVTQARARTESVLCSLFVNRLQFAPHEDFDRYPRTFTADCEKLAAAGCTAVFAPDEGELYPTPQTIHVTPPDDTDLEHTFRPTHFRGVLTVVLKLFEAVQPQVAVFGKKDYQQLFLIRQMVTQLCLPIEIEAGETVREADGLALSSRNQYLSPTERAEATRLRQVLQSLCRGGSEPEALAELQAHGWQPDYVTVRSQATLKPPLPSETHLVALGAARLGTTRLIDNIEFTRER